MLNRIWRSLTRASGQTVRVIRAAYDAAKTTWQNRKHWAEADTLDAVNAMNAEVRAKLRSRARYECANNPIVAGIADTLADDVIGVGPSLSIDTEDAETGDFVEDRFHEHATAIDLWDKCRVAERALVDVGECFVQFVQNDALLTPVKLDVLLIEADRVYTPMDLVHDPFVIDGIRFDGLGNRIGYYVAKRHPGDPLALGLPVQSQFDFIEARHMVHHFRQVRPGQVRGIPELTPSLTACAETRRWSNAVVRAAELAASAGAVLIETELPPHAGDEINPGEPGTGLEYQHGQMTFLPAGTTAKQMKAEQPVSTHDAYMRGQVRMIARPVSMPLNIALCDSSGYNYASGRLDHQTYDRSLSIRRNRQGAKIASPFYRRGLAEAVLISGFLPQQARTVDFAKKSHSWDWQERDHVDPLKASTANTNDVENLQKSLREIYGRRGRDVRRELRQIARERAFMRELGLGLPKAAPAAVAPNGRETDDEGGEKEGGDEA